MSRRISIDITDAQHAKLEALEALLDDRLNNARSGGISSRTVADIIDQVRDEVPRHDPNG